jgi:glycosyltransferase involved in cell wall biosynthesis
MAGDKLPSVLFISRSFPPRFTGDGKHIARLASRLAALGHQVSIVCEGAKGEWRDPEGVQVLRLKSRGQSERVRGLTFGTRVLALFLSGRICADVVVTQANIFLLPLWKVVKALGRKWVYRSTLFGSDDAEALARSVSGRVILWALQSADAIICPTDLFHASFSSHGLGGSCPVVIPYDVDTAVFFPVDSDTMGRLRHHLQIREGPVVVFVGDIIPRKGVDVLVAAWQHVLQRWPNAHLLLVGPMHPVKYRRFLEDMRTRIDAYGGSHSVTFVGEVANPAPYLQMCDLFVFPTLQEGFGMAMVEAMACCKPVVATRFHGYTPFLGRHGHELWLTEPNSEEHLAQAIIRVLGDQGLQRTLAESAYRWVCERFSLDKVAQAYSELLVRLSTN